MNAETFRRLEDIFHQAAGVPPGAARERVIANECRDQAEMAAQVRRLLWANAVSGERASGPPAGPVFSPILPRFGSFQAESLLGQGGAGIVYRAKRCDGQFEQTVAVKQLHLGGDGRTLQAFADERRILARLQHPGIAAIYDGGTTESGSPYLVMEYVAGLALGHWLRPAVDSKECAGSPAPWPPMNRLRESIRKRTPPPGGI